MRLQPVEKLKPFWTHLVSSPVFSLGCHIVALWRWGWGSVFDTETCCSWGRVCACWRSAGWLAGPSLPCAAGSASWQGQPSCCAQLTQGARRVSLSRWATQAPRMMDRNGQQKHSQKDTNQRNVSRGWRLLLMLKLSVGLLVSCFRSHSDMPASDLECDSELLSESCCCWKD